MPRKAAAKRSTGREIGPVTLPAPHVQQEADILRLVSNFEYDRRHSLDPDLFEFLTDLRAQIHGLTRYLNAAREAMQEFEIADHFHGRATHLETDLNNHLLEWHKARTDALKRRPQPDFSEYTVPEIVEWAFAEADDEFWHGQEILLAHMERTVKTHLTNLREDLTDALPDVLK